MILKKKKKKKEKRRRNRRRRKKERKREPQPSCPYCRCSSVIQPLMVLWVVGSVPQCSTTGVINVVVCAIRINEYLAFKLVFNVIMLLINKNTNTPRCSIFSFLEFVMEVKSSVSILISVFQKCFLKRIMIITIKIICLTPNSRFICVLVTLSFIQQNSN